jgi:hypothetical protein
MRAMAAYFLIFIHDQVGRGSAAAHWLAGCKVPCYQVIRGFASAHWLKGSALQNADPFTLLCNMLAEG